MARVPVAYDLGGDTFEGTLASLSRRGLFVSFGNARPRTTLPARPAGPGGSLYPTRPTLFDCIVTTEELDAAALVFGMVASGKIAIEIGQTFALSDAQGARGAGEPVHGRGEFADPVIPPRGRWRSAGGVLHDRAAEAPRRSRWSESERTLPPLRVDPPPRWEEPGISRNGDGSGSARRRVRMRVSRRAVTPGLMLAAVGGRAFGQPARPDAPTTRRSGRFAARIDAQHQASASWSG